MKNTLIVFLLLLISSCAQDHNKRNETFDFIPDNTSLVIKVKNLEALNNEILENSIVNWSSDSSHNNSFKSSLQLINKFETQNDVIVAFAKDSISYSIVTKYTDSIIRNDSNNIQSIKQFTFKAHNIDQKIIASDTLYTSVIDSFFIASNSLKQIEKTINITTRHVDYAQLLESDAPISIHVAPNFEVDNMDSINKSFSILNCQSIFDVDSAQDYFSLNGILKVRDSSKSHLSYINRTLPQENKIPNILPDNTQKFISYTADDFTIVQSKFMPLDSISNENDTNTISNLINEISSFEINGRHAFALRSIDINALSESINSSLSEIFRQVHINAIDVDENLKPLFYPLIDISKVSFYFALDEFMVFTESMDDAQKIISSYTNKATLIHSNAYKNIHDKISDESSILYYANSSELDAVISNNVSYHLKHGLLNQKFDKNHVQVLQIINDNGFSHVNLIIQELKERARLNSISEEFNIILDNDLLNAPQLVKNHVTEQMDIVVQDIENNLYLITNRGKILWKKKINDAILGKIQQIDSYKNGRFQMAFATSREIYVIDRNGNNVGAFPKKFIDNITQPLSVFDYDKTKNYRFLVVQGNKTHMYDSNGKPVTGFTFNSANKNIISQPKHFRVSNKDYIVFAAGNKMHILNRRGQIRITPKASIGFSENDIYLYKNNFTTTNTSGQLVQVDQKGNVTTQNLLLSPNHNFSATSKTSTSLDDNKLTIRSKSIELDYGNYTAPKIFYLKDKIYVSVTDLQTQKIYLFNSQADPIANFPVYGNSAIELDNMDKDKNLEFVIKGGSNSIILYQLN